MVSKISRVFPSAILADSGTAGSAGTCPGGGTAGTTGATGAASATKFPVELERSPTGYYLCKKKAVKPTPR